MSSLNHKPDQIPPVICDFGWTYGPDHLRLPEYTYWIETFGYPPGITTLNSNVTLPVADIPSTFGSLAELQAQFPAEGTIVLDNVANHAVVRYTGLATISGGIYGFTGCTGGSGAYLASGTTIYDPRTYVDSLPTYQIVTFDALDTHGQGLPVTVAPAGVTVMDYRWDFGNGLMGYGPQAFTTYPYSRPSQSIQAALTVTDSRGRNRSCAHALNLTYYLPIGGSVHHPTLPTILE